VKAAFAFQDSDGGVDYAVVKVFFVEGDAFHNGRHFLAVVWKAVAAVFD
jgi:hypothetical protein